MRALGPGFKKERSYYRKAGITAGELGYHIYGPFRAVDTLLRHALRYSAMRRKSWGLRHVRIKPGKGMKLPSAWQRPWVFKDGGYGAEE